VIKPRVIAGTRAEAILWARARHLSQDDFIQVNDPNDLRELEPHAPIVFTGNWQRLFQSEEMQRLIEARRFTNVKYEDINVKS
jgi:hypothetical protein